jgi:putative DNA primase/helicase
VDKTEYNTSAAQVQRAEAPPPVILRDQPLQTATEFHRTSGERLRRYRHTWYRWEGPNYRMISSEEAALDITEFLASGVEPTGTAFHPKPGDVNATLQMLMKYRPAIIEPIVPMPGWLPEATDAEKEHDPEDLISCRNGIVDLRTSELLAHTPNLLTTSTTSYDYLLKAKRKRFERFLDEIFPGSAAERPEDFDSRSAEEREPQLQRELLQEVFGYLISRETRHQKIFLFIGQPRSGKGTLGRILRRLLGGEQNVIGFSLAALDNDFGAEDLIDKQVALVGDARLDGSSAKAVAQLLSWSGEDPVTINRKGEKKWNGTLGVRVLIQTNSTLHFSDPSGTIATRFVPVLFKESFEGRENENLTDELLAELPGILNWAIEGWRRLRAKGKFVLTPASQEALSRMKKKAAPILNFVEEECQTGPDMAWSRDDCYQKYTVYCKDSNNKPLSRPKFVEAMEDLNLGIKCSRPQAAPGEKARPYIFFGVGERDSTSKVVTVGSLQQGYSRAA